MALLLAEKRPCKSLHSTKSANLPGKYLLLLYKKKKKKERVCIYIYIYMGFSLKTWQVGIVVVAYKVTAAKVVPTLQSAWQKNIVLL